MPNLLKRIELAGFKSFAGKTVFDFSEGITAIVGPNGSGKSNVIDAVRWLLGEREAKNLRGAKSEDLIFAGTPKRPRLGQAHASLHFDNQNNFFPVDFPEVTVSRQVNRDGTNQYFINKSEVRLRDLVDFFAQARLGARGLVVVTQGNSDMFIQANPAGRREMIEEMLGLREYQLKKEEAERRLRNTQINLDKVKALTEEILPHLRSLKRQTNRWEKRETLETELRALEDRFFGSEWLELKDKSAAVEEAAARHERERGVLAQGRAAAEANLKKVEASQPEERRELNEIKKETHSLLEKRSSLQKELGRLEAQLEIHAAAAPAVPGMPAAKTLFELVKRIKVKLEIALDDPEKLERAVTESVEEIEQLLSESKPQAAPAAAKPAGEEVKGRFEAIGRDLADLERTMLDLKDRERNLEQSQEAFYSAFKSAVAALEGAKDRLERWETAQRELQFERERVSLRRAEWERQVRQAGRMPEEFAKLEAVEPSGGGQGGEGKEAAERRIFRLRGELAAIGEIDEALLKEARETETRYEFLNRESADLEKAKEDLRGLITELNEKIHTVFSAALDKINEEFNRFFGLMFGGGQAHLRLQKPKPKAPKEMEDGDLPLAGQAEARVEDEVKVEEPEEEAAPGIEISLSMPRKRITSLDMLSGGERSLVGIAALFAMVSVSPPPFLVLDEIDAPLDERNARRFAEMLKEFSKHTQFVLVTHNRVTMESADILYGVTMGEDGTSQVISLKLENASAATA